MPRINESRLLKKLNTCNALPNLISDSSTVRSQSMCRSNLNSSISKLRGTNNYSYEMRNGSQLEQLILNDSFNSPLLTENRSIFLSDNEIGEKVEDFIFHTSNPRQLIVSQSTETLPM